MKDIQNDNHQKNCKEENNATNKKGFDYFEETIMKSQENNLTQSPTTVSELRKRGLDVGSVGECPDFPINQNECFIDVWPANASKKLISHEPLHPSMSIPSNVHSLQPIYSGRLSSSTLHQSQLNSNLSHSPVGTKELQSNQQKPISHLHGDRQEHAQYNVHRQSDTRTRIITKEPILAKPTLLQHIEKYIHEEISKLNVKYARSVSYDSQFVLPAGPIPQSFPSFEVPVNSTQESNEENKGNGNKGKENEGEKVSEQQKILLETTPIWLQHSFQKAQKLDLSQTDEKKLEETQKTKKVRFKQGEKRESKKDQKNRRKIDKNHQNFPEFPQLEVQMNHNPGIVSGNHCEDVTGLTVRYSRERLNIFQESFRTIVEHFTTYKDILGWIQAELNEGLNFYMKQYEDYLFLRKRYHFMHEQYMDQLESYQLQYQKLLKQYNLLKKEYKDQEEKSEKMKCDLESQIGSLEQQNEDLREVSKIKEKKIFDMNQDISLMEKNQQGFNIELLNKLEKQKKRMKNLEELYYSTISENEALKERIVKLEH